MTTVKIGGSKRFAFLDHYRRITSSGRFIPEIDGLRFFAIFSIYAYHLADDVFWHSAPGSGIQSNWLFRVSQVLNVGVPLFFVISGFILSLPFAEAHRKLKKRVPLKKYFLRRVTRLEPPYFLSLLVFFVVRIAADKGTAGGLLPNLIASIFYVHNPIFGRPSDINFVAWSLEIEIQFYILAPVLGVMFAISNATVRRLVLVAAVIAASAVSIFASGHPRLQLSLLGYAQYFLAGFVLAEFYLALSERRRNPVWDILMVGGWILLLFLLIHNNASYVWVAPWIILALYIAAFHGVIVNRFVTNPWITTIGGMCYTIYLLHNYIIAGLGSITERFGSSGMFSVRLLIQFVLMTPIVLAICGLYFRFVERPCMRPDWPPQLKSAFLRIKLRRGLAWMAW